MILLISGKIVGSANMMMSILTQRGISAFRFNVDMFDRYQFVWNNNEFEIVDPIERRCFSSNVSTMVFFKGLIPSWYSFDSPSFSKEKKWLISTLNRVYNSLACYGVEHNLIRLWRPYGLGYAKTLQMKIAKKYFSVPDFKIYWGKEFNSHSVIAKPLTQHPLSNGEMCYAKIVNQKDLDPRWPWFTQEIADGDRDATVLYINGHIHCYQFATTRGTLSDWRVTQGTEANQWIKWDAGHEFEQKIDLYMREMKLKYGRLDFIIGGKEPQFLEVNPEGQFGWLDDENGLPLHNEVVDAILDPSSTVNM